MRLCNRTANKAECCLHINNFAFTAAFSADRNVKAAVGKKKRERERKREVERGSLGNELHNESDESLGTWDYRACLACKCG